MKLNDVKSHPFLKVSVRFFREENDNNLNYLHVFKWFYVNENAIPDSAVWQPFKFYRIDRVPKQANFFFFLIFKHGRRMSDISPMSPYILYIFENLKRVVFIHIMQSQIT